MKRQGVHYSEQKIRNVHLREGDIILARRLRETLKCIRRQSDLIIVEDVHHQIVFKARAGRAIVIFSGIIIAASTGVADIMECALTGVLLLIVGTIALGTVMEKTGASRLYAESMLGLLNGLGPRMILCGILVLTSLSTNLLSNNATAVLMIPVAISTAQALGFSHRPFVIAVCFGASTCFATPIGYKTNLMVYGPGHYRFSDHLKLGSPLNIMIILMGSIFIPYILPL
jgi:di/tricarboxylate transporter